jgi:hypothetical protein
MEKAVRPFYRKSAAGEKMIIKQSTIVVSLVPTGIIRRKPFARPGSLTQPENTLNLNKLFQSNTLPLAMCRRSSFRRSHFCR